MPSSITRLVEAIRKATALTECAPLTSTDLEAASAAKEHDEETKRKKPPSAACLALRSPRTRAICSRVMST